MRRWRAERGQAFTEYVMISGLVTAIAALIVVSRFQTPFREAVKQVIQYVLGQALNPPFSDASVGGAERVVGIGMTGGQQWSHASNLADPAAAASRIPHS